MTLDDIQKLFFKYNVEGKLGVNDNKRREQYLRRRNLYAYKKQS